MFFWNSLACPIIQRMLAISSLVPLPFLIPEGKSGPEGQNNLPTAILTECGSCGVWTQAFCLCRACSHLLCSAVETTEAVHWKMMGFLHLKRLFKHCFLEGIGVGTLGAAGGHLGSTPRWKSYKTSPHARLLQWHLFFFYDIYDWDCVWYSSSTFYPLVDRFLSDRLSLGGRWAEDGCILYR